MNICTTIACMATQICASTMNRNSIIAANNASRLDRQCADKRKEQQKNETTQSTSGKMWRIRRR